MIWTQRKIAGGFLLLFGGLLIILDLATGAMKYTVGDAYGLGVVAIGAALLLMPGEVRKINILGAVIMIVSAIWFICHAVTSPEAWAWGQGRFATGTFYLGWGLLILRTWHD